MNRDQLLNDPLVSHLYGLDARQAMMWTAMPAIVQSVNLTAMTLVAQISIMGEIDLPDQDPEDPPNYVKLPLLLDVPICFPSAGGFSLTLPIVAGDEVLVIIASRCIDSWWQNGGIGVPVEARMHDLSDGFAIPGPRSQPRVLPAISSVNAQLRNDLGTVYIEVTPAGIINLVAPAGINLTSPAGINLISPTTTVSGTLVVDAGMAITGAVVPSGGTLAITGAVAASGQITTGGIGLSTHKHTGITTGPNTSGGPTP